MLTREMLIAHLGSLMMQILEQAAEIERLRAELAARPSPEGRASARARGAEGIPRDEGPRASDAPPS